ncbi:uncharacterized protein KGF55_005169 [Candida pseudojiufengensis]|uniref:uncharacterized protein n=1 Tax=Candida pseudojiufengensis TaxID=497109 RepID=UPI0022258D33|nr:uncharacterized protein KGF55_005169 [Candida pseudojiufengensis]KAI5959937.1 hypothetical protein KGF55_005169 [Candida pseudojiufengensis]
MSSNDQQIQIIIKSLQHLGYNEIAQNLINQYRINLQNKQKSEIPKLLNWFNHLIKTFDYKTIDDYLNNLKNQEEFINITNYKGKDYKSIISIILYLIRRFNFYENSKELGDITYISENLLPLLEQIDKNEIKGLFDQSLINQLNYEEESQILLKVNELSINQWFFNLSNNNNANIEEIQDLIFNKFFKYSNIIFNSPKFIPLLSTILDQSIKYQLSQSPTYLPPRNQKDLNKINKTGSNINFNSTKLLHTLTNHLDEVWFLKFSPSGKYLVTGSHDGRLIIYDVLNNFNLIKILEPTNSADSIAFVPFTTKPSSGKSKAVIYCTWDLKEEYLVSCCLDTVIRVWSLGDLNKKRQLRSDSSVNNQEIKLITSFTLGQDIKTWSVEFLPSTQHNNSNSKYTPYFIVGSPDKVLKIFDINGIEIFDFYANLEDDEIDNDNLNNDLDDISMKDVDENTNTNTNTNTNANTNTNSSASQNTTSTTTLNKKSSSKNPIDNPFSRINDLVITPNGKILITVNNEKQILFFSIPEFFDTNGGDSTSTSITHKLASLKLNGKLTSISISKNGQYILINSAPEELQVWDILPLYSNNPPILYRKFLGHSQSSFIVRSSFGYLVEQTKTEELVLSGSDDGFVYFWKLHTGQLITRIKAHDELCNAVDWNLNGFVFGGVDYGKIWGSVGDDKLVKIWGV